MVGRYIDVANFRVVEFAEGICVPYAARLLADLGAEVIKVENAPTSSSPFMTRNVSSSKLSALRNLRLTPNYPTVSGIRPASTHSPDPRSRFWQC